MHAEAELLATTWASDAPDDPRAFGRLVQAFEARVYAFVLCVVGDASLARDLTQQTFFQLWQARRRYRAEGRFREYLFTIARNVCRSHQRRAFWRAWLPLDLADTVEAPDAHHELQLVQAEQYAALRAALHALPEKFRVPLTLRFIEGLEYDEIARIIGRTESAARSRIHYGLHALTQALPKEFAPPRLSAEGAPR